MTTPITSTTDSQMHNNIMAAGSRIVPLCLKREDSPYKLTTVTIPTVHATDDTLGVPEQTAIETLLTMSPENKAHYESENEAIHLLLTGIGDEIYSTIDACKTAHEMWIAIKRLQTGKEIAQTNQPLSESLLEKGQVSWTSLESIRICEKFWNSLQKYFKSSTHLPTTTLKLLHTPETRMRITTPRFQDCQSDVWAGWESEEDTDEEIDEQALEAHYGFMAKIQEVLPPESNSTAEPLEQFDKMMKMSVLRLTNLIPNLKLMFDEIKRFKKQLKKSNTSLAHELKECKSILAETSRTLRESNSIRDKADESLAKYKALELLIERLLREVVNQDIMSIVQSNSVVDTSNLQTELEQCKYEKISYDKAYNDMQQKIERLQAQLGDQKGKSKDTPCVTDTIYPLPQKLENKNVELEFQVFVQKDTTHGTNVNTKFAKQSILGKPPSSSRPKLYAVTPLPKSKAIPKVGESNALSKQVTSNSVPSFQESKVMKNDNVIAPRMFRIHPRKTSREDKFMPVNKVRASIRTNPITVSQPYVITKKDVNYDSNGLSSTGVDNTAKTRRPQPRSNIKNDRNDKSEVVYAMCKQCLITTNHDICVLNYVNGINSRGKKQKENVSNTANQTKHKPQVKKRKKVGSKERPASPKPSKPRMCLRWSSIGRIFDLCGKIIESSESEYKSDTSV
ncbi:hypothetical protein Tco_1136268 [Tanacetum coccineum]